MEYFLPHFLPSHPITRSIHERYWAANVQKRTGNGNLGAVGVKHPPEQVSPNAMNNTIQFFSFFFFHTFEQPVVLFKSLPSAVDLPS